MSILLGTLCLNEMEHLPRLYEQHKDWPGLTKWVFVESADQVYAQTNPRLVTSEGLSVDGTTQFLTELAMKDPRVVHIRHGFSIHIDPAQGKVQSRNRYLIAAEEVKPTFIFVLDADEYYTQEHQHEVVRLMEQDRAMYTAFLFRQRHIWHPKSIADQPLFALEVRGAYWAVPHCRGWLWIPGMRYENNHNTPIAKGRGLDSRMMRYDRIPATPECIHLGFASNLELRTAKHKYYVARGEGVRDGRKKYVDCRSIFERWVPGKKMPHNAEVIPYNGPIPEVFKISQGS